MNFITDILSSYFHFDAFHRAARLLTNLGQGFIRFKWIFAGQLFFSIFDVACLALLGAFLSGLTRGDTSYAVGVLWVNFSIPVVFIGIAVVVLYIVRFIGNSILQKAVFEYIEDVEYGVKLGISKSCFHMTRLFQGTEGSEILSAQTKLAHEFAYGVVLPLFRTAIDGIQLIIITLFCFYISPVICFVIAMLGLSYILIVGFFVHPLSKRYGSVAVSAGKQVLSEMRHHLEGADEIRLNRLSSSALNKLSELNRPAREAKAKQAVVSAMPRATLDIFFVLLVILISYLQHVKLIDSPVSELVVIIAAMSKLMPLLSSLVASRITLEYHDGAVKHIDNSLDASRDGSDESDLFGSVMRKADEKKSLMLYIKKMGKDAVNEGRVEVPLTNKVLFPGELYGIIGSSGVGKSTLLKRMIGAGREFKVYGKALSGTIDFNVQSWNEAPVVSYMPASPLIISGTVRDNISFYGVFDEARIMALVERLFPEISANNVNELLEVQLDTSNGGLSSGQIQRVCLARSLIRSANLYIFDEPTSNLDLPTEKVVSKVLTDYTSDGVSIIVSHRAGIFKNAVSITRL